MKERINLEGIITSQTKLASFIHKTSAELEGHHNPNPVFYQHLVDNNLLPRNNEDLGDVVSVKSPKNAETPWSDFHGYAFFVEGALYIIDEEWEEYLTIRFHNQEVSTMKEVNKAIDPINKLIDMSFDQGWKRGRNNKIQELNSVLTPDVA